MGKALKNLQAFIDSIPNAKLSGFAGDGGLIWGDQNFRLDMQGVSSSPNPTLSYPPSQLYQNILIIGLLFSR